MAPTPPKLADTLSQTIQIAMSPVLHTLSGSKDIVNACDNAAIAAATWIKRDQERTTPTMGLDDSVVEFVDSVMHRIEPHFDGGMTLADLRMVSSIVADMMLA